MKYDKLTIVGLPKGFKVYEVTDYLYPNGRPETPEDFVYGELPAEYDEGERAMLLYEYKESATGVYVVYNEAESSLKFELSPWASDADVRLYVKSINAVLKKHPRAKLYDQNDALKGLTEDDQNLMLKDWQKFMEHMLKTKEGFTMDGLFTGFTLQVAHLRPAPTIEQQASELRKMFVDMQWEIEEE